MTTQFITNRDGKRLAVIVDVPTHPRGLAFVAHGLGGNKDESYISTFAKAFFDEGYVAVRWDTRNTFGESEGSYEDASVTSYLADMEDVIAWAKTQPWYREPFALAGHSLGGICTLTYAERHPSRVLGIAPISTVVSGKLSVESWVKHYGAEQMAQWKRDGWIERVGSGGKIKRSRWNEIEDRQRYDALRDAHTLTMPALLIVGDKDERTPVAHQRLLFAALPGPKEIHILPGQEHVFKGDEAHATIYSLFRTWIQTLSK